MFQFQNFRHNSCNCICKFLQKIEKPREKIQKMNQNGPKRKKLTPSRDSNYPIHLVKIFQSSKNTQITCGRLNAFLSRGLRYHTTVSRSRLIFVENGDRHRFRRPRVSLEAYITLDTYQNIIAAQYCINACVFRWYRKFTTHSKCYLRNLRELCAPKARRRPRDHLVPFGIIWYSIRDHSHGTACGASAIMTVPLSRNVCVWSA